MSTPATIIVLSGGPSFHPVADQWAVVADLLGDLAQVDCYDGAAAFDHLGDADLFVAGGLAWTALGDEYQRPSDAQKQAFVDYVAGGRPVLAWHGGTGSFDDWPQFATLLGFRWNWERSGHSEYGDWHVDVEPTGHPVVAGVDGFDVVDELYRDIEVTPGLATEVHATARHEGRVLPMVVTAEGGRIDGAGRTVFLANGHDLAALEAEGFRTIVRNTVGWLLEQ